MTLALSKALEDGAKAVVCASTGNTSASAAAYAARAGLPCSVVVPAGRIALGKLAQAQACGARVVQIDGSFDDALAAVRELDGPPPDHARQQPEPLPPRGPEDGRLRGRGRPRRRARLALPAGRQRRQHRGLLARLPRVARSRRGLAPAPAAGVPGRGRSADRHRLARRPSRHDRDRDPDRPAGALHGGEGGRHGVGGRRARRDGRGDPGGLPSPARDRGRVLRAGVGRIARRPRQGARGGARRGRRPGRPHPHGARAEGSGHGGRPVVGAARGRCRLRRRSRRRSSAS